MEQIAPDTVEAAGTITGFAPNRRLAYDSADDSTAGQTTSLTRHLTAGYSIGPTKYRLSFGYRP
jgi:hypothetical protein